MGAKRDRLMRTPNTAKRGDDFWVWDFADGKPYDTFSWNGFMMEPKFATQEEAEKWGKEAQEVFEYFNK